MYYLNDITHNQPWTQSNEDITYTQSTVDPVKQGHHLHTINRGLGQARILHLHNQPWTRATEDFTLAQSNEDFKSNTFSRGLSNTHS